MVLERKTQWGRIIGEAMITVEIKDPEQVAKGASEVEIYCDREGLNELIRKLEALANGETHVHLMSPSWAGHGLPKRL